MSDGDWSVDPATLTLPPFAGPNDTQIILGTDLPACMQTRYVAAIIWRQSSPQFRGQYYIGIRHSSDISATFSVIERGFVLDDPETGTCWIYVIGRITADFDPIAGNSFAEQVGNIQAINGPAAEPYIWINHGNMQVSGDNILMSSFGDFLSLRHANYNAESGTGQTNSGTYANYPGNPSVSFTKQYDDSDLDVRFSPGFYVSVSDTGVEFAVNIGGTDYKTHHVGATIGALDHRSSFGERRIQGVGVIPAGTVTITGRWRRKSGTGDVRADNNDWVSLSVFEVSPIVT